MSHGPAPQPNDIDRAYWESGRDGVLRLQRCSACGHVFFPPGRRCVRCGSPQLEWSPMSGRGTIWSWTEMHKQYFPGMPPPPYVVVRVRLEEGPYLMTNMVGTQGRRPEIGARVRVVFEPAGDLFLPQFTFA
jgi:uncharacterized OB-fold protein